MSKRGEILNISNIKRDDIIHLAGFIDGDGCFLISKRTKLTKAGSTQYMMKLQFQSINEQFIDSLHEIFGGVKISYKRNPPRNPLYGVEFTGNLLTQMCEILIPHLKLKKPNAVNMLAMRKTYNGTGGQIVVPQATIDYREHLFYTATLLNSHKPINRIPPCLPSA
jgi:LAGLIDADG DNA endonuclease family protein